MGSQVFPGGGAFDAELTALRVRAYGIDADIDADPVAAARLAELEQLHAASAARAGLEVDPSPGMPRGAEPGRRRFEPADSGDGTEEVADGRSWWTRTRAGFFLTGVGVATAAALAVAGWLQWTAPRPDITLHATGEAASQQVLHLTDYARRQLVMKSTLRSFEPIMGLDVWSARSVLGNRCLLVFDLTIDDLLAVGCVPPSAQPQVDIYDVPVAWGEAWTERFPSGTVVRFVLTGDTVDVWIYEGGSSLEPADTGDGA